MGTRLDGARRWKRGKCAPLGEVCVLDSVQMENGPEWGATHPSLAVAALPPARLEACDRTGAFYELQH